MTDPASVHDYLPLDSLRLALAASLRAAALGRDAIALLGLPPPGSEGWKAEWLASVRFTRAEAQRWRALVDEVRRLHARTSLGEKMGEKARELSRVERQARRLLAEVSRTVDLHCESNPRSDNTTCDLTA